MPISDAASTEYAALHSVLRMPAAEVRTATDLVKDPWGEIIDVVLAQKRAAAQAQPVSALFDLEANPGTGSGLSESGPRLSGMAPWLLDTMTIIDSHRHLGHGADAARRAKLLDTAEMLASFLADVESRRRPQLNISSDGQPSFATALDDFYIHLTIDGPNLLTWYATVRGAEHFNEGVVFDGRKLPAGLRQLFPL
jgi:hypothetical protein